MSRAIGVDSLSRPLAAVARGLAEWQRGDPADAAMRTLAESARDLHARTYTLWMWRITAPGGAPVWLTPVGTAEARSFSPPGPGRAIARTIAAAIQAGADPERIGVHDVDGFAALAVPGADDELAVLALEEHHPGCRVELEPLPGPPPAAGPAITLVPSESAGAPGGGLARLAHAAEVHPIAAAATLAAHGQPVDLEEYPDDYAARLHDWGLVATPAAVEPPPPPDLSIDADLCPRRRGARRLLRRLYGMKKIGDQHHTEFDHVYRGVPADGRDEAADVARALIRAGLLGEKPSVGQRHVYLRRDALPAIHALMERGETDDPALEALWSCPPPGGSTER